jgi:hypothetical protein
MKNLYKRLCDFVHKNKNFIIVGMLGFVLGYGFFFVTHTPFMHMNRLEGNYKKMNSEKGRGHDKSGNPVAPNNTRIAVPEKFSGTLKEVNTGCFADGECYIVVDDKGVLKHVTIALGWTQGIIGKIIGTESIGDMEKFIGKNITAYVDKLDSDNYTLYGDVNYYVDVTQK